MPEPEHGSKTVSPGLLEALIILARSLIGLGVGWCLIFVSIDAFHTAEEQCSLNVAFDFLAKTQHSIEDNQN